MSKRESHAKPHTQVGVAWYKPDQWERLLAVSVDKDNLEETYEEWTLEAKRVIKELRRQGLNIVKVDVNIEELIDWCQQKNIPVNGEARSMYAAHKLQQSSE